MDDFDQDEFFGDFDLIQEQPQPAQVHSPPRVSSRHVSTKIQCPNNLLCGLNEEKLRVAERLHGFNPKNNLVTNYLSQRFGKHIKHTELLSIANILSSNTNIKLDRDAKRRKAVLLKWFEEHWVFLCPYINFIVLEDTKK